MQIKKRTIFLWSCIFIFSLIGRVPFFSKKYKPFIIMLDPAGDAKNTGRTIENYFERGITLQYAEQLKKIIETRYHNITVYLTRSPREVIAPLQNANYANRLKADLYISINFYQEKKIIPDLFLYQFSYDNDFLSTSKQLCFYPYDQAHLLNKDKTKHYASCIKQALTEIASNKFNLIGVHKIPCKPLIGIISPAIVFEAGLKKVEDWNNYIEPMVYAIQSIIERS